MPQPNFLMQSNLLLFQKQLSSMLMTRTLLLTSRTLLWVVETVLTTTATDGTSKAEIRMVYKKDSELVIETEADIEFN